MSTVWAPTCCAGFEGRTHGMACLGPWLAALAVSCECGPWVLSVDHQRQDDLAISGAKGAGSSRGCEIFAGAELIAGHVVLAIPA